MTWLALCAWPYHEWTYEAMVHDLLPVSPLGLYQWGPGYMLATSHCLLTFIEPQGTHMVSIRPAPSSRTGVAL